MRVAEALLLAAVIAAATPSIAEERRWAFSASLYGYAVPDGDDYVNPNVTADRGALHLEARYQYEAQDTTSLWVGANFSAGESWAWEWTMMLGAGFGEVDGIAPGYRLSVTHDWFELASEGEYFVGTHDQAENFLYTWTEAAGYPTDWFRAGVAVQRTRAYRTEIDIQRGLFVGFTYKRFDAAAYVFNPASDDATYVLALRFDY